MLGFAKTPVMTNVAPKGNGQLTGRRASEGIGALDVNDPIDRVVLALNKICKTATLDFAIAVGQLVINGCYGGDLASWRARGEKDVSFRKLARHCFLPMSPVALYRSVAIYELCERLDVRRWKHVSTSHLRLVLPLAPEQQSRLLQVAEVDGWPVRRLEQEIATVLALEGSERRRGGRKRRSRLKSTLNKLEACVDKSNCFVGFEQADDPSPDTARNAIELVGRVQHACSRLERHMSSVLGSDPCASPIPPQTDVETSTPTFARIR